MNRELGPTFADERCTAVAIQLTEYCAGELDPQEAAPVREHLALCSACRNELAREQALRQELAGLPLVRCPAHLARRLQAVATGESDAQRPDLLHRWSSLVGAVAAAAAVALLLWGNPQASRQDLGPVTATASVQDQVWTKAEIASAREELRLGLLLTARILDQTERSTVKEVLGRTLPRTVNRSLKTLMTPPEGGQG